MRKITTLLTLLLTCLTGAMAQTVTFNIKDGNGNLLATTTENRTIGETVTVNDLPDAVKRAYCNYSGTPIVVADGTNTFEATVTYNLPFNVSDDAHAHWYNLVIAGARYAYSYYDSTKEKTLYNASNSSNTEKTYLFSFYGNPYEGFKIVNAQSNNYLTITSISTEAWSDKICETSTAGDAVSFYIKEIDATNFYLYTPHPALPDEESRLLGVGQKSGVQDNNLCAWSSFKPSEENENSKLSVSFIKTTSNVSHNLTVNYCAWEGEAPILTKVYSFAEGDEVNQADIDQKWDFYKDFTTDVTLPLTVTEDKTITVTYTPNFPFTVGKVYTLKDAHNNKTFTYVDDSNIEMSGTPDLKNSSFLFEHVAGTQNKFQLYSFGGKGYVTMSTINSDKSKYEHATISSDPVVWASGELNPTSQYLVKPYKGYNQPSWTSFRLVHPGNSQAALSGRSGSYLDTWNSSSTSSWEYAALGVDEVDLVHIAEVPDLEYIQPYTIATSSLAPDVVQSLLSNLTKANIQTLLDNMGAQTTFSDFGDLVDLNTIYQLEFVRESARMGVYTDIATTANLTESATYYSSTTNATADANGNVITSPQQVVTTAPTSLWSDNTHFMGSLWQFEKKADGQYYARNVNSGLYISGGTGTLKLHFATAKSEGHYFVMENGGGDVWAMREPQTTYSGREYLNNTYNPGKDNNRTTVGYYKNGTSDPGNQIRFKKVTSIPLSVSAAGWTAFCFPVKVVVPDGVTVYQATSSNGESLHLEEVAAGTVLPAGAGFLCEAAEGTYNFGITAADAADFSSNLLTGATLRRTGMTPNNFYALGNKNGVGFYRVNSETVPANKPFLPASALTSSVREMLSFDFGMATGISNTQNADRTDTSVLYDLNGRRVYYPVRGIYVNGRGEKIFLNK